MGALYDFWADMGSFLGKGRANLAEIDINCQSSVHLNPRILLLHHKYVYIKCLPQLNFKTQTYTLECVTLFEKRKRRVTLAFDVLIY